MALSDFGSYSRRLRFDGISRYADSHGIVQDFESVARLETVSPSDHRKIDDIFTINIKNSKRPHGSTSLAATDTSDTRPIIGIEVNGVPLDVLLDSGAALNIPTQSAAAETLDYLDLPVKGPSAIGDVIRSRLAVVKEIAIGAVRIPNLTARVNPIFSVPNNHESAAPVGQIGIDLLLRFHAVTVDMNEGIVKFNPVEIAERNCAPMHLALDKNLLPAGLVTTVLLDDRLLNLRIDTGFNGDILLYGVEKLKASHFTSTDALVFDDSGKTSNALQIAEVDATIGKRSTRHMALRTSSKDPVVDGIIGIKFFTDRRLTFNFKKRAFCVD